MFFRASAFQQKFHLPCEDGELRAHLTSEPVCPVAADPTKHAHTGKGSISMADLAGDVKVCVSCARVCLDRWFNSVEVPHSLASSCLVVMGPEWNKHSLNRCTVCHPEAQVLVKAN